MTVLVVAAHPDDELLGCGGTLARYADAGVDVHVLILAEGATAREDLAVGDARDVALQELRAAATRAAEILGVHPPRFQGFPDNRMDELPLICVVKAVEAVVEAVRPDVVYTHHGGDLNIDHRIAHQAVLTACRPLPESGVRTVLSFETVSSSEWASEAVGMPFRPQRFVDIGAHLDRKRRALACYETEMRPFPHARSLTAVDALARHRGASAGLEAAEAFMVIRDIDR
jgi:LmbE family N-acetylglucosaminyl deacetylase